MVSLNVPPFVFAGAGNQALLLSAALAEKENTVALFTSGVAKHRHFIQEQIVDGIKTFISKGSSNTLFRILWFHVIAIFWFFNNADRYDVVHVHGCTHLTTLIWMWLGKSFGKHVVYKPSCSMVDDASGLMYHKVVKKLPFLRPIVKKIVFSIDSLIAITPAIQADFERHGYDGEIHVITNGIDTSGFLPTQNQDEKQQHRAKLGWPEEAVILLYTGGMNARKAPDFIVKALEQIQFESDAPDTPAVMFYMVGPCKQKDQSYLSELNTYIKHSNNKLVSSNVTYCGEVLFDALPEYLKAADVFCFASHLEGQPSSPVEAMACGLPSVIVELDGVTNWIYPEQTNEVALVTSRNYVTYAAALHDLIMNKTKREQMGRKASSYVQERFAMTSIAEYYIESVYP